MKLGSSDPTTIRDETDLGRFGMGMKTAAFSLGKKVTVITSKESVVSNASWDLDRVIDLGWKLIVDEDGEYNSFLTGYETHGTAIIISKLDALIDDNELRKSKTHFYAVINKVAQHLRLVFHRFITEDDLQIFVNGNIPLTAWDPFVSTNPATQELSDVEFWSADYKTCAHIQPYVLPHKTKFVNSNEFDDAGGVKGWYRNQGIFLYRNRRLIIYGTWFDIIRKELAFNLARIKIDITSEADEDWKIDIKKSSASLPVYLKDKIIPVIDDCTTRSAKVFNSRGAYVKGPVAPILEYV